MKARNPHRTEPLHGSGRCSCEGAHVPGLALATLMTKGQYMTEPASQTPLHFGACPHSELARTTPMTNVPRRKQHRQNRPMRVTL